jgi:hypothetical protein
VVERHETFNVLSDKTQEFVKLFREEYQPAMASALSRWKLRRLGAVPKRTRL